MTRRYRLPLGPLGPCLALAAGLSGCDYSAPLTPTVGATPGTYEQGPALNLEPARPGGAPAPSAASSLDNPVIPPEDKEVILKNVLELIRTAALKPGGDNFAIA